MRKKVVVVDDSAHAGEILTEILSLDFDVRAARSSFEVVSLVKSDVPDVIITSPRFRTGSAFEMLSLIRNSHEPYAGVPIVMTSTEITPETISGAMLYGICDIVKKPFEPLAFIERIQKAIEKAVPITEADKKDAAKPAEPVNSINALDPITGCHKKRYATKQINDMLGNFRSGDAVSGAMMIVELSSNSFTNNGISDDGLSAASEILKKKFGDAALIAITGRSFIVFIRNLNTKEATEKTATELVDALRNGISGEKVFVSIGLAVAPRHGNNYNELSIACDRALGIARQNGKNTALFYKW